MLLQRLATPPQQSQAIRAIAWRGAPRSSLGGSRHYQTWCMEASGADSKASTAVF